MPDIDPALRPVSHRVERVCPACGQWDDHPRHVTALPDGSTADLHFDCCHCATCARVLGEHGGRTREALVESVTRAFEEG